MYIKIAEFLSTNKNTFIQKIIGSPIKIFPNPQTEKNCNEFMHLLRQMRQAMLVWKTMNNETRSGSLQAARWNWVLKSIWWYQKHGMLSQNSDCWYTERCGWDRDLVSSSTGRPPVSPPAGWCRRCQRRERNSTAWLHHHNPSGPLGAPWTRLCPVVCRPF